MKILENPAFWTFLCGSEFMSGIHLSSAHPVAGFLLAGASCALGIILSWPRGRE